MQTLFADSPNPGRMGNCLQAAVASLLDLPLEEVPHFVQADADSEGDVNWRIYLDQWLLNRGWTISGDPELGELHMALGRSPRHPKMGHAALYRDDMLVHDPHPDGTGLAEVWSRLAVRLPVEVTA